MVKSRPEGQDRMQRQKASLGKRARSGQKASQAEVKQKARHAHMSRPEGRPGQ